MLLGASFGYILPPTWAHVCTWCGLPRCDYGTAGAVRLIPQLMVVLHACFHLVTSMIQAKIIHDHHLLTSGST